MTGRRNPNEYIFIDAILNWDSRRAEMRLKPISGQPFPEDMYIECSKEIRALHPGTIIRLKVVQKKPKGHSDQPHLYSSYKWEYKILDQQ